MAAYSPVCFTGGGNKHVLTNSSEQELPGEGARKRRKRMAAMTDDDMESEEEDSETWLQ